MAYEFSKKSSAQPSKKTTVKKPFSNLHKLLIVFRINTLRQVTVLLWDKTLEAFHFQPKVSSLS